MEIKFGKTIPHTPEKILAQIRRLETELLDSGITNRTDVVSRISTLIRAYNALDTDIKLTRISYDRRKIKKLTPEEMLNDYNSLVADAKKHPNATNIIAVKRRVKNLAKAFNSEHFDFSFKKPKWMRSISLQGAIKDVRKIAQAAINVVKDVAGGVALAPLAPFWGMMKDELRKRGIQPADNLLDIANQFVTHVIRGQHFNLNGTHKRKRHHKKHRRAANFIDMADVMAELSPKQFNLAMARMGGGARAYSGGMVAGRAMGGLASAMAMPSLRMAQMVPLATNITAPAAPPVNNTTYQTPPWANQNQGGGGSSGGGDGGGGSSAPAVDDLTPMMDDLQAQIDAMSQQAAASGPQLDQYSETPTQVKFIQSWLNSTMGTELIPNGQMDMETRDAWSEAGHDYPVTQDDWASIHGMSFDEKSYNIIDDIVTLILDFIKGLKSKKDASPPGPPLSAAEADILGACTTASNQLLMAGAATDDTTSSYQQDAANQNTGGGGGHHDKDGKEEKKPSMKGVFIGVGALAAVVGIIITIVVLSGDKK